MQQFSFLQHHRNKLTIGLAVIGLIIIGLVGYRIYLSNSTPLSIDNSPPPTTWWSVQSVDTMKYSRDLSREKLNNLDYDKQIDIQIRNIANTGATHVAIGVPYDQEFLPWMRRWVSIARKYQLKVWFRGNWSGWEKWFGYSGITRKQHLVKTNKFILNNPELFEDGDIFTPCPECENGGPGDPRQTRDIKGFRKFLIDLYQTSSQSFAKIGKQVPSNYFSMNGDVAQLIMDKPTTKALGGLVVVDHYVQSPDQLVEDIKTLAKQSGGQIILGEFGAPIPDINGKMSETEQAEWIKQTMTKLAETPQLVGINYWTNMGSSTALWKSGGEAKLAVSILKSYYQPTKIEGQIKNKWGRPIPNAEIYNGRYLVRTDLQGRFQTIYLPSQLNLNIKAKGYLSKQINITPNLNQIDIELIQIASTWELKIRQWLGLLK